MGASTFNNKQEREEFAWSIIELIKDKNHIRLILRHKHIAKFAWGKLFVYNIWEIVLSFRLMSIQGRRLPNVGILEDRSLSVLDLF